jgi:hypothetical protein
MSSLSFHPYLSRELYTLFTSLFKQFNLTGVMSPGCSEFKVCGKGTAVRQYMLVWNCIVSGRNMEVKVSSFHNILGHGYITSHFL